VPIAIFGWTGADIINAGVSNDVLNGSIRNDTYIFSKSYSADIIQDTGGSDIMKLGDGINKKDLWFTKQGSDLEISNITNQDKTIVKNWYAGNGENQLEKVELANGSYLSNISIDQLVQAMATFDVKPMAETSSTRSQQMSIQAALDNTWVDPAK
jgi:hypothetical protein